MQELSLPGNLITLEGMLLAEWEEIKRKKIIYIKATDMPYNTITLGFISKKLLYFFFFSHSFSTVVFW